MYYGTNGYPQVVNYPYYPVNYSYRQYPPVDTSMFEQSVTVFQKIASESVVVLEKFTEKEFSQSLMAAAQSGNREKVDQLIKSIGTSSPIKTEYTPSGILLTIYGDIQGTECCALTMYLRWGN
ncbi:hypothetical protein SAMN04487944_1268 [Gracilibacillus ureilyticus]|uniref:Uncharacterized protein n=1 Tax=Gracilibacillus ureilyticus TaxID=531814 RepID=A0A1H9VQ76_9BACI|nr:hypothetical protein [Gracilibacillus ureilyticus]SES23681.1 hypothetical protein SAMN04487944_1268 [Gracilibacillus ureilyticus]